MCFKYYSYADINKAATGISQPSGDGSQDVQMVASGGQQQNVTGGAQVPALGSNVVQVAVSAAGGLKPVQMVGGKQTIVINKPGGGQQQIVTGGAGQQIIR